MRKIQVGAKPQVIARCYTSAYYDSVGWDSAGANPAGQTTALTIDRGVTIQTRPVGAAGRPNGVTCEPGDSLLVSYDYGEPGKRVDPQGRA
jgi:hypothetical protein